MAEDNNFYEGYIPTLRDKILVPGFMTEPCIKFYREQGLIWSFVSFIISMPRQIDATFLQAARLLYEKVTSQGADISKDPNILELKNILEGENHKVVSGYFDIQQRMISQMLISRVVDNYLSYMKRPCA